MQDGLLIRALQGPTQRPREKTETEMTSTKSRCASPTETTQARTFFRSLVTTIGRIALAYRIYQERRALMALSDRTLKDIGLSRTDAYHEGNRPWWDLPRCR
jgi:uncharacterized protein YjiS (DUF1127 family)